MTMFDPARESLTRPYLLRTAVLCAGVVSAAIAVSATARAESDPTQFNAHLAIFAFSSPAAPAARVAAEPSPSGAPSRSVASAPRTKGKALGYAKDMRGNVHGLIARHAAVQGIPVALADAVVRIESRYNPSARNAGAVGLMQIKPQTARGLGYQGGAAGLMQPETNVKYGMIYLAQAYRMSGGDTCATLMRYQSGHYATRANSANRAYCAKARTIMASN